MDQTIGFMGARKIVRLINDRLCDETMTRGTQFLTLLALCLSPALAAALIHHEIDATIEPATGRLQVRDRIQLPEDRRRWTFLLNADLLPEVEGGTAALTRVGRAHHLNRWQLDRPDSSPVTLRYAGTIRHGLAAIREGMGRTRHWSPGIIAADGVFLGGQSGWYPSAPATEPANDRDRLVTFALRVRLPEGWLAVSQGAGPNLEPTQDGILVGWRETQPQDEIHLIAGPFERSSRATPIAEAQVYLRRPEPALADRYLEATDQYLSLYDQLIGPYPYAKFALVENFWETGYGMPSFTLLGPRVIRLPFILHTSYPHEILHNWWGNGVYVDYESGNWSEGLTAYLADHLLRERQGHGAEYRRDTLQAYADYVDTGRDFPIRAFRGRHGADTQAIGYGKTMMVIHMLRRQLGDATFVEGLRHFYAENRFSTAGFADLRAAFEAVSGRDLEGFFRHWTERTGAPELHVTDLSVIDDEGRFRVRGELRQAQKGAPFPLLVPVIVHTGQAQLTSLEIPFSERRRELDLAVPARPIRLDVDPHFDLFRSLVTGEAPVTLSRLFGTKTGLIVLPAQARPDLASAFRNLAEDWSEGQSGWSVTTDSALDTLPTDQAVWLLGWGNRFLKDFASQATDFHLDLGAHRLELPSQQVASAREAIVLAQEARGRPIGWLAAADAEAVIALARKVPHYGKYSYLVFAEKTAENRLKGQWELGDTALKVWLGPQRPSLSSPPRPALVSEGDDP